MLVHVAVADPLTPYAQGVMSVLRARGVSAEAPTDLETWADDDQRKILFLTVASEGDWERLTTLLKVDSELLLVAVLHVVDETSCLRALTAGAVGILPRGAPPEALIQAVHSLARGQSVVPLPFLRALAGRLRPGTDEGRSERGLSPKELDWLRQLAEGTTVRQLATSSGYSERMMFRLLRSLYHRMNVGTRTEALFLARERGWI